MSTPARPVSEKTPQPGTMARSRRREDTRVETAVRVQQDEIRERAADVDADPERAQASPPLVASTIGPAPSCARRLGTVKPSAPPRILLP
jgi:hypothetical protein